MNEFWQSSPKQKLILWRKLRKSLIDKSLEEKLEDTVSFWKMAPLYSNALDIYDHTKWARPWEFIWHGDFDENSVALGMAYTLHIDGYADCKILLIQDTEQSFLKLLVSVNDVYILNYKYGEVNKLSDLSKNTVVVKEISVNELT